MNYMRRKLLYGKMIRVLAVFLVLFMAGGVAEDERTDAGGQWKYVLEEVGVTIPESVTGIGGEAFARCFGLTNIDIPSSVTSIGEAAFGDCGDLTLTVEEGSFAEQYAKENNIPYVFIAE